MKNEVTLLNSDGVNRYNMRFTAATLESALRQKWLTGTPCNLGHDQTKTIGWMTPLSLYFEPGLTRLMGVFTYPETDSESEVLAKIRYQYLRNDLLARCQPFEAGLKSRIGQHLTFEAAFVDAGVPAFYDKELAVRCFPKLFQSVNKDGLVRLNAVKHLGDGIFDVDGLALFGHVLFRRSGSLLNHVNHHFFNSFDKARPLGEDLWVALDRNLVGWSATYHSYLELEYWWGPKFQDDLVCIQTGVTRHESTEFERLYSGILRTEFWWQSRKGEHILEIEELKNVPYGDGNYHCRYLHCIVDEATGAITHFDGAVRTYTEERMIERFEQSIDEAGRQTTYAKLWRIDHPMEISKWKRLVSDYFVGNHLVGEYLGAEPELRPTRPETAGEVRQTMNPKLRWVPYSVESGSGVRVNFSYNAAGEKSQARSVLPIDTLTIGEDKFVVVSLFALELQKLLRRAGHDLFIPAHVRFVACEDLYVNLPVIVHNHAAAVPETLDAIGKVLHWTVQMNHDRAVALTVTYPLIDREIQLSVYGHAKDLLQIWPALFDHLPTNDGTVHDYVDNIAAVLQQFPASVTPVPSEIIQYTGVLWLNRQMVQPDMGMKPSLDSDLKQLRFEMALPPKYHDLGKCIDSGDLSIRVCSLADEVRCSICGKSHFTCPCSVVLDGATKYIEKITPAGFVITDRPA